MLRSCLALLSQRAASVGPERLEALQLSLCFFISRCWGGRKSWELVQAEQSLPKMDLLCSVRQHKILAEERKYLIFFRRAESRHFIQKHDNLWLWKRAASRHRRAPAPRCCAPTRHCHRPPRPPGSNALLRGTGNHSAPAKDRPAPSTGFRCVSNHYRFQRRGGGIHSHFCKSYLPGSRYFSEDCAVRRRTNVMHLNSLLCSNAPIQAGFLTLR